MSKRSNAVGGSPEQIPDRYGVAFEQRLKADNAAAVGRGMNAGGSKGGRVKVFQPGPATRVKR
jgi:hypothetical protein